MKITFSSFDLDYHLKSGAKSLYSNESKYLVENFYVNNILKINPDLKDNNEYKYDFSYSDNSKEIRSVGVYKDGKLIKEFDAVNLFSLEEKFFNRDAVERFQLVLNLKEINKSFTSYTTSDYEEVEKLMINLKQKYGSDFFDTIYIRSSNDYLDFENMPNNANIIRNASKSDFLMFNIQSSFLIIDKCFNTFVEENKEDVALNSLIKNYDSKNQKKENHYGKVKDTNIAFNEIVPFDDFKETALYQVLYKDKEIGILNITGNKMLPYEFKTTFKDNFKEAMSELENYPFSFDSANISSNETGLYHDEDMVFNFKNKEIIDEDLLSYFMNDLSSYVDDWKTHSELKESHQEKTSKINKNR